jgi:hypothetical protein
MEEIALGFQLPLMAEVLVELQIIKMLQVKVEVVAALLLE